MFHYYEHVIYICVYILKEGLSYTLMKYVHYPLVL